MATISLAPAATRTTHPSHWASNRQPYWVQETIDFADALASKGSALADADVIEVMRIPANTVVLGAGIAVVTAANATTGTVDLGVTGVDADEWANDFDIVAGTYGTDLSASPVWNTYAATDTIDLVLASVTGTLSTGVVRVYALMMDVSPLPTRAIAALGS